MRNKIFNLFVAIVLFAAVQNTFGQTRTSDSLALLAIYNTNGGSQWDIKWNLTQSISTWHGVTVSSDRVTSLSLPGSFNNPFGVTGTLSTEIAKLDTLQTLNLPHNEITGLPSTLWKMTNLKTINLYNNKITGSLPTTIDSLINLTTLELDLNELSGVIPLQIGNLANLTLLSLANNKFTGAIPSSIGNLSKLQTLSLFNNSLIGAIPTSLGNLTNLTSLSIYNCPLSGSIPSQLGNLVNLTSLDLFGNNLTGTIPNELQNLIKLNHLNISSNQLSGPIPSFIGNITTLKYLYLYRNKFTGTIPESFVNLKQLDALDVGNNLLSGLIPTFLGSLVNLTRLDLYGNRFNGTIPTEFQNLVKLNHFNFADNQLSGSIPSFFGNLTALQYIYLQNNKLTGTIPDSFGNLSILIYFYVSNNHLTGAIPASLTNLKKLKVIDLSSNQFTSMPDFTNSINESYVWTGWTYAYNLNVTNNRIGFSDLIKNVSMVNDTIKFGYSPQYIGDTIFVSLVEGQTQTMTVDEKSSGTSYKWKKNGTVISGATADTYTISAFQNSDEGTYFSEMINSNISGLTIYRNPIYVQNKINEAPTNINLTSYFITEGYPIGTSIGKFSSWDNDPGDSHTYSLVVGEGDTSNVLFTILGNELLSAQVFSYDVKSSYSIRVRSTDAAGATYDKIIKITVDRIITCDNSVHTGVAGTINDGSYEQNYDPDFYCSWLIDVDDTRTIKLTFSEFATESCCDFVSVYDGSTTNDTLLGKFSGTTIPGFLQSSKDKMLITFKTNGCCAEYAGWTATYSDGSLSGENDITDFSFPGMMGQPIINATNHTIYASANIGVSLSNITPTFTLSQNAVATLNGVLQTSGVTTNNFAETQKYKVTAQDGFNIQEWAVMIENGNRALDSLSLITIYNSNGGSGWDIQWDFNTSMDKWHGITLKDGRVSKIVLEGKYSDHFGLTGSLTKEIGSISNLEVVKLNYNDLTSIPSEIGYLHKLKEFYLYGNSVTTLPNTFGDIASLTTLELGYNNLSDSIPSWLQRLTNLSSLYLSGNNYSGTIPDWLSTNLTKLVNLSLRDNKLSGSIPANISGLNKLIYLDFGSNKLTGSIPPEFGNLLSLELLYLYNNKLSGTIPVEITNLSKLRTLHLSTNQLSGTIPEGLKNLVLFDNFYISGNDFTGVIPSWLSSIKTLKYLDLGYNDFTGNLPTEFGNLTNLVYLSVAGNKLSGPIPNELTALRKLKQLYLNNNQFTTLPDFSNSIDGLYVEQGWQKAYYLYAQHNKIGFDDIKANLTLLRDTIGFQYNPQYIDDTVKAVISTGSSYFLSVSEISAGTSYSWKFNDNLIDTATSSTYTISSFNAANEGTYTCEMINSNVPDLTITRYPIYLQDDQNNPPYDIYLSSYLITENSPIGTEVATLYSGDSDPGDTYTYALVPGEGDTGNASFKIEGNKLYSSEVFSYDLKSSYSIRIVSTDSAGLGQSFSKAITITIDRIIACANGAYTGPRGVISDGSEEQNYDSDFYCTWLIDVDDQSKVSLKFTEFATEDCCDFVYVYDGPSVNSPLIGKYSGFSIPPTIQGTSDKMLVTFSTNGGEAVYDGWRATYSDGSENTETDFTSFTLPNQIGNSLIDPINHIVIVSMPNNAVLSAQIPTFELSDSAKANINGTVQISNASQVNFSQGSCGLTSDEPANEYCEIEYKIIAENQSFEQIWTVRVVKLSNENDFESFSVNGEIAPASISKSGHTVQAFVFPTYDLKNVITNFTLSPGAIAFVNGTMQNSGVTSNNFTEPVTFKVVAQDQTSQNWTVTISDSVNARIVSTSFINQFNESGSNTSDELRITVDDTNKISDVDFYYRKMASEIEYNKLTVERDGLTYIVAINLNMLDVIGMQGYFEVTELDGDQFKSEEAKVYLIRSEENTINTIPTLSFGKGIENYQIITIPYALSNESIATIFDELMPYNPFKWRMFHYSNGESYEYEDGFTSMETGKGYWLIVKDPRDITIEGSAPLQVTQDDPFTITLSSGWNQIGNPYTFNISWQDVLTYNENPSGVGNLTQYSSGKLIEQDILEPFKGGFVNSASEATLKIPLFINTSISGRIDDSYDIHQTTQITDEDWFVTLSLSNKTLINGMAGFGMHPNAEDDYDGMDVTSFPLPQGLGLFYLDFNVSDDILLSKSIVSAKENHKFEFYLEAKNKSSITLQWDQIQIYNANKKMILNDKSSGVMTDMSKTNSYEIKAGSKDFSIIYGNMEFVFDQMNNLNNSIITHYPNPVSENQFFIELNLRPTTDEYKIGINIYDLSGVLVFKDMNINLAPGRHTLSPAIQPFLQAGMYIIEVSVIKGEKTELYKNKLMISR